MYKKVPTDLNFVGRERDTLAFWKENKIFEKSMEERKDCPNYTFYDGPPTANGKPHIGHVLTRVIKDMIPRYHAMKGCNVPRQGRMGHPRPSRRAGSRKDAGHQRKRANRGIRDCSLYRKVQGIRMEI